MYPNHPFCLNDPQEEADCPKPAPIPAALNQRLQELQAAQKAARRRQFNNPILFLETDGLYCFDPDGSISTRELYQIYRNWCIAERIPIETLRTFCLLMRRCGPMHALRYSTITDSNGKRCRGYRGIRALSGNTDNTDVKKESTGK